MTNVTYDNVSFSVTNQEGSPEGFYFNPDGTKMYVVGSISDAVHQYTLATGFDLSTASYDNVSFSVSGQAGTAKEVFFSADGIKMYILDSFFDAVYQYSTGL